jgi:hypothetical protein
MTAWVDPKVAAPPEAGATIGWEPSLDRLEKECLTALRIGRPDPWLEAEVACWLDLVDAERARCSAPARRPLIADVGKLARSARVGPVAVTRAARRRLAGTSAIRHFLAEGCGGNERYWAWK